MLTAVCEFLRFCARTGLIEPIVAERLSEPRWLRFTPPGFDAGESGQFRTVRARALKARAETPFPEALTARAGRRRCWPAAAGRASASWWSCCCTPGFGSARRSGCAGATCTCCRTPAGWAARWWVRTCTCGTGPTRTARWPSPGSRARCRPATRCSPAYADYQHERAELVGEDGTEMVLVNLYHEPLGAPMTYRAAKGFFDRLAGECGFPVRPHMLRHSAATNWVRAGVDLDVVRALARSRLAGLDDGLPARPGRGQTPRGGGRRGGEAVPVSGRALRVVGSRPGTGGPAGDPSWLGRRGCARGWIRPGGRASGTAQRCCSPATWTATRTAAWPCRTPGCPTGDPPPVRALRWLPPGPDRRGSELGGLRRRPAAARPPARCGRGRVLGARL